MPSDEAGDTEVGPPSQDELYDAIVTDDWNKFYEYRHGRRELIAESASGLCKWMEKQNFFPSIYEVNERGNVTEVLLHCRTFTDKRGNKKHIGKVTAGRGWV